MNACRVCHESLLSIAFSWHRPKKGRLRFLPSMACGGNPGVLVLHPATQGICLAVISIIAGNGHPARRVACHRQTGWMILPRKPNGIPDIEVSLLLLFAPFPHHRHLRIPGAVCDTVVRFAIPGSLRLFNRRGKLTILS
uniref:Uncharacterized protein n=1 Tax=Faecalibaculum rodentium TaxID=1702221 RepID=A0A140DRS5_9FIRM|nr:hypothetical protein AALO17_02180 [Faecalibaculum rodentium]